MVNTELVTQFVVVFVAVVVVGVWIGAAKSRGARTTIISQRGPWLGDTEPTEDEPEAKS